jgi:transcriptional regulator with XRE-family HTH domain
VSDAAEIGTRLKEYAKDSGGPAMLARKLGISPQTLNNYLSGQRRPGGKMQERLEALGCDVIWLMTGDTRKMVNEKFQRMVDRLAKEPVSPQEFEIVSILRTLGIRTTVDFHIYFDYARAVQDKLDRDRKRRTKEPVVLRAAEGMATYNKKKKGGR